MTSEYISRIKTQFSLDRENSWIFGVCAGLAHNWHLDPAAVRVGVVIAGLFFPKVVIAVYLIAWLVLDDKTSISRRYDYTEKTERATRADKD